METAYNMTSKNLSVFFVTALALIALASSVSAFGSIESVEVNGVNVISQTVDLGNFAGERVHVLVTFKANSNAEDVRVKAWFSGESENAAVSERFGVLNGTLYTRTVLLDVPHNLREELHESRVLNIVVENRETTADQKAVNFRVQRTSYNVQILSIDFQPEIKAGESLAVDVVLKNIGSRLADDTFIRVRIPELGLEKTTYYGDLSSTDQSNPDRRDSVERRTFLRIPVNVPSGLYTLEIEAYNADSIAKQTRRVLVTGASEGALTVPSSTSKTFSAGETAEYKLTLVNRGTTVSVYTLETNAPSNLNLRLSDTLVVVPAGSSRTVSVYANSSVRDDYTFSVKVNSEEGVLVSQHTFVANVVDGGRLAGTSANATVLLTVILAIVFIVLLVVLIVLLTRKPETKEEFGESYY